MESYALLFGSTLSAGTVLALAALGLLINEKAGIINLGAEGMMLCAAMRARASAMRRNAATWREMRLNRRQSKLNVDS